MLVAVMMRLHRVAIALNLLAVAYWNRSDSGSMAITMQQCREVIHPPVVSATDSRALKRDTSW